MQIQRTNLSAYFLSNTIELVLNIIKLVLNTVELVLNISKMISPINSAASFYQKLFRSF